MAEWSTQWGYRVQRTTRRGIYRVKTGGFLLVARVTGRNGKRLWSQRLSTAETLEHAQRERDALVSDARATARGRPAKTMRFAAFAASLYERKVLDGTIGSASTVDRWDDALTGKLVPAFGDLPLPDIRRADIEAWKGDVARRIAAGTLSPSTANGWLRLLLEILRASVAELELDRDPTRGVAYFSTADHPTYTDEDPNALTADQARAFLERMRGAYPQHYAMTLLGFVTGLRPSSLRSLRCSGDTPDVLWREDAILVRRSNSRGQSVRETTKTKRHQRIHLPDEVMGVLAGHVALVRLPALSLRWGKGPLWWREPMAESALLFPARHGGFLSRSVLDKPFASVSKAIGLGFALSPRGMRRTFQDLARTAEVHDVVTRSISGHTTETMQRHYSTAAAAEQRDGIGRVLHLVKAKPATPKAGEKAGKR